MNDQRKRIHPHKFTLWVGIGSIVMMFAGLTSAYIVKRNLANWITFDLPVIFWYSTLVIVVSSITIMISRNHFKNGDMRKYRKWLVITMFLGILFVVLQTMGFISLWDNGITLTRNVSFSFLYIIVGLHAVHVIAGVITLAVILIKAFSIRRKNVQPGNNGSNEHLLAFCRFSVDLSIDFFNVDQVDNLLIRRFDNGRKYRFWRQCQL